MESDHFIFERLCFLAFGGKIFVHILGDKFRECEVVDFFFADDIVFALFGGAIEKFALLEKPYRSGGDVAA